MCSGKYILSLKELIGMKGNPILVKYSNDFDDAIFVIKNNIICQSLQEVRYANISVAINEKNCVCKGGSYFVGLSEYNVQLLNFWKNIEKSHNSIPACLEFVESIKPLPEKIAENILLSSSIKNIADPDLVIFICNADGIARLLGLYNYAFGNKTSIVSYTAACSAAIGIPMGHNKMNVTFIDNSARKIGDYDSDELMITIPYHQLESIYNSIERCVWGGIEVPYLKIEKKFRDKWVCPGKTEEI